MTKEAVSKVDEVPEVEAKKEGVPKAEIKTEKKLENSPEKK